MLFIGTRDGDRVAGNGKDDVFEGSNVVAVGSTQLQFEVFAFGKDTLAGTVQCQLLGVAFGDPDDHVCDEGTIQTVERTRFALFVRTSNGDGIIFKLYFDRAADAHAQLAFGSFDGHIGAVDGDFDTRSEERRVGK